MTRDELEKHCRHAAQIHDALLVLQTLSLKTKSPLAQKLREEYANKWDNAISHIVGELDK